MDWHDSKEKPKKNGHYLLHIYRSPIYEQNICLELPEYLDTKPKEYVTLGDYDKELDSWLIINDEHMGQIVQGVYKTYDYIENVFQLHIIEWMELPKFIPISARYKAIEQSYDNPYITSLVKQRKKSCDLLKNCKMQRKGRDKNTTFNTEIRNEKEFKALYFYFTTTKTNNDTGEIVYDEPVNSEYAGSGIYETQFDHKNNKIIIKKIKEL